jgi:hypothetical protein
LCPFVSFFFVVVLLLSQDIKSLLHLGCAKVASLISQFEQGMRARARLWILLRRAVACPCSCACRCHSRLHHSCFAFFFLCVFVSVTEGQPLERIKDILAKGTKTDSTATK